MSDVVDVNQLAPRQIGTQQPNTKQITDISERALNRYRDFPCDPESDLQTPLWLRLGLCCPNTKRTGSRCHKLNFKVRFAREGDSEEHGA